MSAQVHLWEVRSQLREQLTVGPVAPGSHTVQAVVHDTVPESITSPCVVIQPGEEWLVPSDTFAADEYDLTYELWALVEHRSNAQATRDLEQLLGQLLTRLDHHGWAVDRIDRAGPAHTADWLTYGQRITVSKTFNLTFRTPFPTTP